MKPFPKIFTLAAGLLCCSGLVASAIQVKYQVDLSVQIALGNFNPATDNVFVAGTQSSPTWQSGVNTVATNFILTPSSGDPNIYEGTFPIVITPGNWEEHKFVLNGNNSFTCLTWDNVTGGGNRFFQAAATDTVLPVVYFSDQSTMPNSIPVTFNVDMGVQITLGNFNAGSDYVVAAGGFNVSCGNWAMDFVLTNIPSTTIYSGTWDITRISPGGTVPHKFVINGGTWESIADRTFTLPNAATNLPVVYFNNITPTSTIVTNPVTFQINMAVRVARNNFVPGTDSVTVAGEPLNAWNAGTSVLTNDTGGVNPYLYSGTFNVGAISNTTVSYKFTINGGITWEDAIANRTFASSNSAITLPVVFFENINHLGSLTLSPPSGGASTVSWTGGPLVRLQTNAPLTGTWGDVPGTEGASSANITIGPSNTYFRLIGP